MPFHSVSPDLEFDKVSVAHESVHAKGHSVGGDALFFESGRHDLKPLFLMIDVSGHGPEAAVVVNMLMTHVLNDKGVHNCSPERLLAELHSQLAPAWAEYKKVVCATAVLADAKSRRIYASNAGLPYPMVGRIGVEAEVWAYRGGLPLGIPDPKARYAKQKKKLENGRFFIFLTDGVTEAALPSAPVRTMFGHDRVKQVILRLSADSDCSKIVDELRADLESFAGSDWPEDDTTILAIQFD